MARFVRGEDTAMRSGDHLSFLFHHASTSHATMSCSNDDRDTFRFKVCHEVLDDAARDPFLILQTFRMSINQTCQLADADDATVREVGHISVS